MPPAWRQESGASLRRVSSYHQNIITYGAWDGIAPADLYTAGRYSAAVRTIPRSKACTCCARK